MQKIVHPASRKPEKATSVKKGYLGVLKTRKGSPGKSYGLKRTTMTRWITYNKLYYQRQVRMVPINTINFFRQARDKMLEDIGAIAELKPNKIIYT